MLLFFSHSHVQLFATLWTVCSHQAPLSMGFSRQNTGVGCYFLLQRIFPTQESNLHCRQILYPLSYEESPNKKRMLWENLTYIQLKFYNTNKKWMEQKQHLNKTMVKICQISWKISCKLKNATSYTQNRHSCGSSSNDNNNNNNNINTHHRKFAKSSEKENNHESNQGNFLGHLTY